MQQKFKETFRSSYFIISLNLALKYSALVLYPPLLIAFKEGAAVF
jgi:hypothetical protein